MRKLLPLLLITLLIACDSDNTSLPNILILYADDMGYGDLAIQNPKAKLTTPNLDQLARDGIRFTDGHSASGICTPSRFALLTGQYHWRRFHGIVGPFGKSVFGEEEFTLARMLKQQGYNTACIGKWHLGWDWEAIKNTSAQQRKVSDNDNRKAFGPDDFDWTLPVPNGPLDQGFDYYFGDGTINFPPYGFMENDKLVIPPTEAFDLRGMETKEGGWEFRPGPMVQDWDPYQVLPTLMEKAVEWIENQDGEKPFFLYFPFPSPHAPIIPGDEFDGKTDAGAYGDFVFQTDYVAGQVLEALERKGFTDETLVIFTADNGPEHYAYPRIQNYGHYSMGPLRGLKRDIYEGGHRVPFLIKWPGIIDAGQVSTELIHQVDILATLAHLIGFVLSDSVGIDSYNQLPLLLGESTDPVRTSAVHNTRADGFAFRKNNWLFLDRYTGHNTRVPNWFLEEHGYDYIDKEIPGQLFDLRIDTAQKMNLYIKYPELVEKMKLELELEKNRKHSVR